MDRLEQIFRGDKESRLMELFLFHFRQTGNTVEQCFLGTTAFDTIDPANLEALLLTRFKGKTATTTVSIATESSNIEQTSILVGVEISHFPCLAMASLHKKVLHGSILESYYDHRSSINTENLAVFEQSLDDLIDILSSQSGVVDLQPLFFRLTLDISTEFLFGESVKSLKAPRSASEQTFGDAFNTAQAFVAQRFRLPDLYWLIGGSEFRKACNDVHRFADQIIDRNLSRGSEKGAVFLDLLAERTPNRDALRGQIISLLAAGRDTTACLLTWTFFLLVRHPKVLEKLREEVNTACSDLANLTRTELRKMRYLQNVLKETLRLYPSVPVNDRKANKTTLLPIGGGPDRTAPVLIPKGASVAYSIYAMHRRPDLYGMDAELFRHEIWDEDMPMYSDKTAAAWGYLPFNGGPRICLGSKQLYEPKNNGTYTD